MACKFQETLVMAESLEVRTYLNPAHFFMLLRARDLKAFCKLWQFRHDQTETKESPNEALIVWFPKHQSFKKQAHGTDFFAGVPDSLLKDL